MFRALVIEKDDAGYRAAVQTVGDDRLPVVDGGVTVDVAYSTVNYKDGLAITGKSPVVRKFPLHAGIDFAGTVSASSDPRFKPGDEVLLNGVQGITDLITTPGLINVDFADVKGVMSGAGTALMGIGSSRGEGRALKAAEMAINSPLLEASMEGAQGVLMSIAGGSDLGLFEINEAASLVQENSSASPPTAPRKPAPPSSKSRTTSASVHFFRPPPSPTTRRSARPTSPKSTATPRFPFSALAESNSKTSPKSSPPARNESSLFRESCKPPTYLPTARSAFVFCAKMEVRQAIQTTCGASGCRHRSRA